MTPIVAFAAALTLLFAMPAHALTITPTPTEPGRIVSAPSDFLEGGGHLADGPAQLGFTQGRIEFTTSALTGMRLNGQAATIDLLFPFDLTRMLDRTLNLLTVPEVVGLVVNTTAPSHAGSAGPATASFIRPDGSLTTPSPEVGRGDDDGGRFFALFVAPFDLVLATPDAHGLRLNFTFPTSGFAVTGTTVLLTDREVMVPEPASGLLLAVGLGVLGWARRWRKHES